MLLLREGVNAAECARYFDISLKGQADLKCLGCSDDAERFLSV